MLFMILSSRQLKNNLILVLLKMSAFVLGQEKISNLLRSLTINSGISARLFLLILPVYNAV